MDGSPVIVSTSSHLYYDRNGAVLGIEGVLHDITGLKDKETELKKTYEQIAATEEESVQQDAELERSEKQIRESEVRHRYLLGLFENAQKSEQELFMAAIEGAGVMTGSPLGYLALVSDDESELRRTVGHSPRWPSAGCRKSRWSTKRRRPASGERR